MLKSTKYVWMIKNLLSNQKFACDLGHWVTLFYAGLCTHASESIYTKWEKESQPKPTGYVRNRGIDPPYDSSRPCSLQDKFSQKSAMCSEYPQ